MSDAKKKREEEEKAQRDKINAALAAYEERQKSKAPSAISDIAKRIQAESEAMQKVSTPSWGEDSLRNTLDETRESRVRLADLQKELESYNSFLDKDVYDTAIGYVTQMRSGYDSVIEQAKGRSEYKSEDDYNVKMEEAKKQEADYQAKLDYDLEAGKAEIEALEKELAELKIPENEARGIESAETLIAELEARNQILELARAKGDNGAADEYNKNKETIAFYRAKIKEASDPINAKRDELTSSISQKKAYHTLAERAQKAVELASVVNNEDFQKYSLPSDDIKEMSFGDKVTGRDYDSVGYLRNNPDALEVYEEAAKGAGGSVERRLLDDINYKAAKHMNKTEYQIYTYYYNKDKEEGTAKAEEFLKSIEESLNLRIADKKFGDLEDKTFKELLFGIEAGLDQFETGIESLFSNEDYIPASAIQLASGMVREDLADNSIPVWYNFKEGKWEDKVFGNSVGQVAYDSITTTSNMLPSIMVSFVPVVGQAAGAVTLGASAAGHAKAEMLNLGYSKSQANLYGVMVGASEAGLQYLLGGITKLGGVAPQGLSKLALSKVDNAFARAAITLGFNMAGEFTEEALQTVIEPWLKSLVTGVDFESPDIDEVLYSGLLGALSSLGLEGASMGANVAATYAQQIQQRNEHGQDIIDNGGVDYLKEFAREVAGATQGKDSKKLTNLAEKVEKKATDKNVGKLSAKMEDTIASQNRTDIQKALVEKGLSAKDAKRVSEYLLSTETLTAKQKAEIEGNENIKAVAKELLADPKSNINERGRNLMAARLGVDTKNAKVKATESGELSLRNDVDVTDKVSEAGKTTLASTGETITIDKSKPIAKIEYVDGERVVYYNTDHGTVEASNVKYASEAEGLLHEAFVDMNPSFANAVIKNYDGSVPVQTYINGMREGIVLYGMHNFQAVGKDISKNSYLADLSEIDQNFALKLGRAYAKADATSANADLHRAIANAAEKAKASEGASTNATQNKGKKGKVSFEDGAKAETHKQHRKIVSLAKVLASAIGIDIVFYDSRITANKDGRGANGFYDEDTDTIYLDLQNAKDDAKTIAYTLSHELVHFIKKWSPVKFNAFAEFLMEQYASHGVSASTLLKNKMAELNTTDVDKAYEEMICDACETMLLDSNAVVKLMELRKSDLELFEKIRLHILKILNDIREAYKKLGYQPTSDEAKALLGMKDVLEHFYSLFEEAAVDATKTYQASIGTRNLEDFSKAETTDGKKLFQYKAIKADENTYREMLHKWGKMSTEQIDNLFATIDTAVNLIKENLEVLDYAWEADIDDRAFSPVKPNSDKLYQVSLDFSTLCRKRILQQTIIAQLQEALNKPLSKEEGIAIRDALIALQEEGRQIEVACALCYVESARMKSPEQIKRFVENREAVIKEFFAGKSGGDIKTKIKKAEDDAREKLHKENPNGVKGKDGITMFDPREAKLKTLSEKYAEEIRAAKRTAKQSYTPTAEEQRIIDVARDMTVSDFTSPEGLENLAKNYPSLFDAYTSYIRNATKSKGIENDTWWRAGDSMQIGDVLIANMNRENGLRSQSWSDFQVVHILDYIAATIELATRETKEQAYTKVPDYAELMGSTGVMINLSLIPTAKFNGTLDYDSVEGIDYKRALELRDKYHRTVGTICIGVDNVQIKMLLAEVTIDYVIPYHKSGMSAAVRKLMHIPSWSQYEEYQSEKNLSRAEAKKQAEKYGVKLLGESDPNYQKGTSFSEWFDIKEAQQIATIENANPSDTAKHKKYGVMYGGYMAMQNAANNYLKLCAERGLSPKFSHEKANFTAEENYWKLLIDRKMIDNITGEVIEQQTIKPVFDEGEIMRILNDELERYPSIKADQDYAIRKVTEGMLSGSIKGGMSAEAISKVMKTPVDNVTKVNILASNEGNGIKKQVKRIVGASGTDYGVGVYLDSTLLTNLTEKERVKMVKEYVKELGGSVFTAYDQNQNPVDVHIAEASQRFKNKDGKSVPVNKDLTSYLGKTIKQESIALIDELILTSTLTAHEPPLYSHDWLDNYGKNDWEYWSTYVQDKENTIWEATLNIATAANGEKILYDIVPIKMVEQSVTSDTSTTKGSISHPNDSVKKQLKKTSSSYAPTFYSYMGKVIDGIKIDKMGANGVVPYLKGKGVKDEEIKWSGIETFLEGKKSVTKTDLQEFVAGSQLVIEETNSGINNNAYTELDNLWQENFLSPLEDVFDPEDFDETTVAAQLAFLEENGMEMPPEDIQQRMIALAHKIGKPTRWEQYKLDGGTNYRELVFKMPNSSYSNRAMRTHWGEDAEGVLVHARIQDFDVDGKKMLFIEELQSDWHNEGHAKGYTTEEYEDAVAVYDKLAQDYNNKRRAFNKYVRSGEFRSDPDDVSKKKFNWLRSKMETAEKRMQEAERHVESLKEKGMGDVPDAPFRSTYHEYVLKRLLRMATEEGYDSIGWTPAEIQVERWSEEFAEGYRIEYDQDMPSFLKKYGKKWGAKVGKTAINNVNSQGHNLAYYQSKLAEYERMAREAETENDSWYYEDRANEMRKLIEDWDNINNGNLVWSMDITDSMKDSVLYEGQPKFQKKKASNRTILANALESVAQNDIEINKLKQYKDKISLIEAEQAKLAELNGKIKELSFAKGTRDTEGIRKLQFEAKQTANRINTYDRQLLNLEATTALKGVLDREKAMAYKKAEQKGKEALAKARENAAKTQRELLTRYQESRKKGIEGRHKTEMRYKIKNVVNDLNTYLLKGTKEKHVPIGLQKVVAEALDAVNMDTVGAEERIAKKREEMRIAASKGNLEQVKQLAKEIDHIEEMGGNLNAKLERLKTAYDSIINSEDPLVANSHDEVISNTIAQVIEVIGDTSLRDMNLYQLEAVYKMYRMLLTSVRGANKAFKAAKNEEISTLANRIIEDLVNQKKLAPYSKKAMDTINQLNWNNLKPIYAFERIGSNTFTDIYNNVRAGEDTWARDMVEAQAFLEEQKKKYNYKSFDFGKKYEFTSSNGHKFSLNLEQIMSLYAYSKRGEQAKHHLRNGGFQFDKLTEVDVKDENGKRTKKYLLKDPTAYKISDELLAEIIGVLDKVEGARGFADSMQEYLSSVMGEKGNEVSLAMYDVKLFGEKNYFPLKVSEDFLARAREQAQGDVKIKNKGFTKTLTEKAAKTIVLAPFMDVWAGHVNEMSMYHAFTLPLEDFYRVFNYSTPAVEGMDTISLVSALSGAHREGAVQYIDQLLKDLNGGARSDPRETAGKKLMTNFKKAAVMLSLSVVIQQPSAIGRATALVNSRYFVGKKVSKGRANAIWEEMKKYAPVVIIKDMGGFDTGMGKGSVDWLKGDKTFMDKVDDVASWMPAKADQLTWIAIWNAVKRETLHTHKNLNPTSEEFLKIAGERFTEVITKTQVYDSTLSRSGNMRSKSLYMNMVTSFMAEPTTSINMLEDALRKGKKGNVKYMFKAMGAVYGSVLLNSALVSLVYAMRDDDEDETYLEKYLSRFTSEMVDGVNPLTYIPFVKDIWSAAQGFDIERADMTLISSMLDSMQQFIKVASKDTTEMDEEELAEHHKAINEGILSITDNLASLVGLPVKNVRRDFNGIINAIRTISKDATERDTTWGSLGDAIGEEVKNTIPVWGWLPDEKKEDKLYDAIIKGDDAYVARFKDSYESEKSYTSAIRKALQRNDPRIKEAAIADINGDIAEKGNIIDEIVGEGNFDENDILSAIKSEVDNMTEDDDASETTASKDISRYDIDDYYISVGKGDTKTANIVKEEIIDTKIANGYTKDEAEKDFASDFRSYVGNAYKDGEISRSNASNMLVKYGGFDNDKVYWDMKEWDYKIKYGEDAKYSKYTDFYDAVKTGVNLKAVITEYTSHGVKTETLASQITTYYKPLYKEMSPYERASIKGYLLNAYQQLGYNRTQKSKDIDKWLED